MRFIRATRVLEVKTYSAAVNRALEEVLRVKRIQALAGFFGQGLWQGDLARGTATGTLQPLRATPA